MDSQINNEKITEIGFQENTGLGTKVAYASGTFADNLALQNFTFLGFSFYFTVIGLDAYLITIAYVIWSIWDAFDDPLIGVWADKTKTKWGRRKPWIVFATLPLCVLMIILWTPPTGNDLATVLYLIFMLILFDFFFTTYTVNFNSLWPEMFLTSKDRGSIGVWRNIFTILALLVAYLVPGFIIDDFTNQNNFPYTPKQFVVNGVLAAGLVLLSILVMLIWGSFERKEFSLDVNTAPNWKESYKITFKNKAFILYAITALAVFIVYGILPIILPFYAVYVLGMPSTDSMDVSLLIFTGLLVGALSTPLWMVLRNKLGVRKAYMISLSYWGFTLILFMFAQNALHGFIVIGLMGFGLGGSLYLYDQGIALIIDDDEVRSGLDTRREGAYYGVIAFFNRFSNAINLIVIGIVFTGTGWGEYNPKPGVNVLLGLRLLTGVWPVVIIIIALICLYYWPITKERLAENQQMMDVLHAKKREKTK